MIGDRGDDRGQAPIFTNWMKGVRPPDSPFHGSQFLLAEFRVSVSETARSWGEQFLISRLIESFAAGPNFEWYSGMPRGPRIQLQGAVYHVMARGNRKAVIFDDDQDRLRFLEVLAESVERYRLRCHSYCLMGNHYHAVVETPDGNLSEAMHFLNGVFTQASNRRHQRTGHLLEGRFSSVPIDNDVYLRNANLYVAWNPVASGLVAHPAEWPWSSYRETAGVDQGPGFLSLDWLDLIFGGNTREESQRRYRNFMSPSPADTAIGEALVIGAAPFQDAVRAEIGARFHELRVPRAYKALARPTLAEFFGKPLTKADRNTLVVRAHVVHGYRLSEIAEHLRVHPNTLSRIFGSLLRRSAS